MPTLAEIIQKIPDSILMAEVERRFSGNTAIEIIHAKACEHYGADIINMRFQNRIKGTIRQTTMHLMSATMMLSRNSVAKFYNCDPGTVRHAEKATVKRLAEPEFASNYQKLCKAVEGSVWGM
jgi:hypothetical protein